MTAISFVLGVPEIRSRTTWVVGIVPVKNIPTLFYSVDVAGRGQWHCCRQSVVVVVTAVIVVVAFVVVVADIVVIPSAAAAIVVAVVLALTVSIVVVVTVVVVAVVVVVVVVVVVAVVVVVVGLRPHTRLPNTQLRVDNLILPRDIPTVDHCTAMKL